MTGKTALVFFVSVTTAFASVTLTDRYGETLRAFQQNDQGVQTRVPLASVSPWMVLATLAAEDKRFFNHRGVDLKAALRALWQNSREGRVVSGGSTLTQQLVRLLEPRPKTFTAKLKESLKALRLERTLPKREIFEAYLNEVYYANRFKGVEAAAQGYWGVPSCDLSLAQAAFLAGIPKSPVHYDPLRRFDKATHRQKTVLDRMKSWGWITEDAYRLALAEKITVSVPKRPWGAPHFTEYVRTQRPRNAMATATTLDASLQRDVEPLVQSHLARLAAHQVTNAALVILDNSSGDVLAWVGSADFFNETNQGQVDGVTALRQPGSALKPVLYALAFSKGRTPATVLLDAPINLSGYIPRNYDDTFHGAVRAREALACSFNIPAVLLAQEVGIPHFLETLRQFGFASLSSPANHYGFGLALGVGEVTLLELTNAYAALARGGIWQRARVLNGPAEPNIGRRVMDRESAYLVTDILSDNAARVRAFGFNSPFHLPFAFAAKTGTTKDYRDNWAVGYTPDWTIGVWVGNFDGKPMRKVSGITGAGPLLRDAALVMAKRAGTRPFPRPRGIRELEICPLSGLLPSASCPERMREVFAKGNVPKQVCPEHEPHSPAARPSVAEALRIEFPVSGDIFRLNPRLPREAQAIRLRANGAVGVKRLRWWVNQKSLPLGDPAPWWVLKPGKHHVRLTAEYANGRQVTQSASFIVVP